MGAVHLHLEGAVARLVLSHPERLNALSVAMWQQLKTHVCSLHTQAQRDQVRVLVISGAEGNFAAGADITEFPLKRSNQDQVIRSNEEIQASALQVVADFAAPVFAAIVRRCM